MQQEGSTVELALPFVRPAVLLWLATLGRRRLGRPRRPGARTCGGLAPDWDRATFLRPADPATPRPGRGRRAAGGAGRDGPGARDAGRARGAPARRRPTSSAWSARPRRSPSGRRVVQLTPLGRYVLALGPPPPPRPTLRALPVRAAELRDHRLSPGADPGADRPVQPVRALVAGRRGAGAEAHARVGLPRPGRGPDARRRCSTAWPGTARGRCPPASPRRSGPGPAAASG